MASCKSKSQLKSVLTSRSNGRRGAKITTALSPLPASPCSTNGTLSSRASVDRGLSSSSGPFFDPEPSASQGLLPPSQAMELVLKDIAKAVRTHFRIISFFSLGQYPACASFFRTNNFFLPFTEPCPPLRQTQGGLRWVHCCIG